MHRDENAARTLGIITTTQFAGWDGSQEQVALLATCQPPSPARGSIPEHDQRAGNGLRHRHCLSLA